MLLARHWCLVTTFEHTLCTCSLVCELICFSAVVMLLSIFKEQQIGSKTIANVQEKLVNTLKQGTQLVRLCFRLLNYSSL